MMVRHSGLLVRIPRPNKPMLPTAPTSPVVNPLRPMLRHTGEPLGSFEGR